MSSLREFLTGIANAIRNKKGTATTINAQNFASEIESIETGITPTGTLDITENGSYDVTNYASASVNVASSGKDMLQARVDATNNADYLFYKYTGDNVDFIKDLDLSNVTSAQHMFSECGNLTTIPQLDTSNATDMYAMFFKCGKLTNVPQLYTSNATKIASIFYECGNLTTIPQLDTSNATDIHSMFFNCGKLTNVPQLDTSNATKLGSMFQACRKLEKIDISRYNCTSTSDSASFANNCNSLKKVVIRSFGYTILNSNAFGGCYHLTGTVDATYNPNGDKDGYIYVPRNMVNTLKSATNWSTYADQIRALEDYTVDGTTTGDLDETKI